MLFSINDDSAELEESLDKQGTHDRYLRTFANFGMEFEVKKESGLALVALAATLLSVGVAQAAGNGTSLASKAQLSLLQCARDVRACLTQRFTDNGDGTVTDHQTGLMWAKTTGALNGTPDPSDVRNVNNTYLWCSGSSTSCTNSNGLADGPAFTDFLATLNSGVARFNGESPGPVSGCFANHCDWRLPTATELFELVELNAPGCANGSEPCIDPALGPTQPRLYWSSTTITDEPGLAMVVDFSDGTANDESKNVDGFARAVRGSQ